MDTKQQVIKVFKRAIESSEREGKSVQMKNLFGHLARHHHLREWFLRFYPIATQHIMFIHDNPHHFNYDSQTGFISVNGNPFSSKGIEQFK
ncbi:hypothetical protein HDE_09569 [Halotydeus destructor]|nr:hypothetical protein HDE_09569 [Halotydeus destructor]